CTVETRWNFSITASGEFSPWEKVSGLSGLGTLRPKTQAKRTIKPKATPRIQKILCRRRSRGSSIVADGENWGTFLDLDFFKFKPSKHFYFFRSQAGSSTARASTSIGQGRLSRRTRWPQYSAGRFPPRPFPYRRFGEGRFPFPCGTQIGRPRRGPQMREEWPHRFYGRFARYP